MCAVERGAVVKILVLGGTGFLGPHVVRYLAEMGQEITIFHTGGHEPDLPPGISHVHDPLARIPIRGIPDTLKNIVPDVVVHMVPEGEADARIVMEAFTGIAKRIVAISSQDVYRAFGRLHRSEPGPPEAVPLTEESPLREKLYHHRLEAPRNKDDPYRYWDDSDKILVERIVMSEPKLPGTILRLPMIYGPRDPQRRIFKYLKRMDDGRPTIILDAGMAKWRGARGYVENVAWAVALAVSNDNAAGRIYNVAEAKALTEAEWVGRIAEIAGWEGKIVIVPEGILETPYDTTQHWVANSSLIRGELGYHEIVPQEEALMQTIAWERSTSPAEIDPRQFNYAAEDAILDLVERHNCKHL